MREHERDLFERIESVLCRMSEQLDGRTTVELEPQRGFTINHVLFAGTLVIPATGAATINSLSTPFGGCAFYNLDSPGGLVTITTDSAIDPTTPPTLSSMPGGNPGIWTIPSGRSVSGPIAGRTITAFGPAGLRLGVILSTVPFPAVAA